MLIYIKHIVPVVLFTASTFAAFAQGNSSGAGSIPEDQLTAARDRCAELQVQQGTTGSQQPETTEPERQTNQPDGNSGDQGQGSMTFDLSGITLQDCIDQGLTDESQQKSQ
jgi:hypothetical protein